MPRINYRNRAIEIGYGPEFDSLQQLRSQTGLDDPSRLLGLSPRLIKALRLDKEPGPDELMAAVDQLVEIADQLSAEDRLLAHLTWNLPIIENSPKVDKKLPREDWMERSEAAAGSQLFSWTNGATLRHHSNRIIFKTLVELSGRFGQEMSRELMNADDLDDLMQPALGSSITITTSPQQYKSLILSAESQATRISRLPKRVSTIFKSDEAVTELAMKRFGKGSSNIDHYVEEHLERKKLQFASLEQGHALREIYSLEELTSYLENGLHGFHIHLSDASIEETFENWLDAMEHFDHYYVALTSEPLPLKYEIIDANLVIMHEVVGQADAHRINAIAIESKQVARKFQSDFDLIWERTANEYRDTNVVVSTVRRLINERRRS